MKTWFLIISVLIVGSIPAFGEPYVLDPNFIVEKYVTNLKAPTTMSFVGDDILVLEQQTGNVRLVKNGILQDKPVIHFDVATKFEQGLLGITTQDSSVFLYLTAARWSEFRSELGSRPGCARWSDSFAA